MIERLLALAAAVAFLAPASARAASYELASEWAAVSFPDGGKNLTFFTHLVDADLFAHMQDFETHPSSDGKGFTMSVPLYALTLANAGAGARVQGALKSASLVSRVSPYKMVVHLNAGPYDLHAITRAPDFSVEEVPATTTLPEYLGLNVAKPENFLVLVEPEAAAPRADALTDIERAAIDSLDPAERTAWVGRCGGEPTVPAVLTCWRDCVDQLLRQHTLENQGEALSPFEKRYMKQRLSPKSYEQFQRALGSGDADKLALARDWHDLILGQDVDTHAAAAAKTAAVAPAAVSRQAASGRAPQAKPAPRAPARVELTVAPAVVPSVPDESVNTAPRGRLGMIFLIVAALLIAAIFLSR